MGLHQSVEFDEDARSYMREITGPLEKSLKDLFQTMKDSNHEFTTGDLPFIYLPKPINETQIKKA